MQEFNSLQGKDNRISNFQKIKIKTESVHLKN